MKPMLITTPRLRIESAIADEPLLRSMVGWLNDPVVVRYSEQRHHRHTVATQCLYIDMFSGENYLLAVYHCDGDILIGSATIFTDEPNKVANIGIMIGERGLWGMGLGNEAWKAVCDRTLANGYRKVEAGCMACNTSMMCICSHYGMMEEGRQEDHFLIGGQPTDLVHWGKFK